MKIASVSPQTPVPLKENSGGTLAVCACVCVCGPRVALRDGGVVECGVIRGTPPYSREGSEFSTCCSEQSDRCYRLEIQTRRKVLLCDESGVWGK